MPTYLYIPIVIIFTIILFNLSSFSFLDKNDNGRNASIDGLRFLMAGFVVFHHSGFFSEYFMNNQWITKSPFLFYIGKLGVSVFFIISAYLFWGKVNKEETTVRWGSLYLNRLFRIGPLSLFCSLASVVYILLITNFPANNQLSLSSIVPWFDASILNIRPDINGLDRSRVVMAGVTWTLKWEWMFYFSLPFLFLIRKVAFLIFPTLSFVLYISPMDSESKYYSSLILCFLLGMTCFELSKRISLPKWASEIILILSCLGLIYFRPSIFDGSASIPAAFIVFAVTQKASLFGILNNNGIKRLGDISYSIYLIQGLVMYPVFRTLASHYDMLNQTVHTLASIVCFFVIIFISTITYTYIERPCYRLGKKIISPITSPVTQTK